MDSRVNIQIRADARQAGVELENLNARMNRLVSAAGTMGHALAGVFAARFTFSAARSLLDLQIQFDQLRGMLKYVTGDFKSADQEMEYAAKVADRLKINVLVATEAYAKLAAAAKGTALEGALVREVFEGIATAGVAMGQTTEQLKGSFLAITQIMSKQRVSAEELSGQLGERMVGVFQAAAHAVGLSVEDFNQALNTGSLNANAFLVALAREFKTRFAGEVAGSVDGARGALADFENAWIDLQRAFARSGAIEGVTDLLRDLTGFMKDPGFQSSIKTASHEIGALIDKIVQNKEVLLALLGAWQGGKIGAAIGGLFPGKYGKLIGAGIGLAGGGAVGAAMPELLTSGDGAPAQRTPEAQLEWLRARLAKLEKDSFADQDQIARLKQGIATLEAKIAGSKQTPPPSPELPPVLGPSKKTPEQLAAERKAAREAAASAQERARLAEQFKQELFGVQNEILQLTGHSADAMDRELRARYAKLIEYLRAQGDTGGVAIVENLINLKVADERLAELRKKSTAALDGVRERADAIFATFDQAQQNAANRVDIGAISPGAAQQDVVTARETALAQYRALRGELEALAKTSPEAAAALAEFDRKAAETADGGVGGLRGALIDMRKELANMKASFAGDALAALRDSLTQLFVDLATHAKSAKDALKDFVRGFAEAMVQIAARILATAAVVAVISALPGGAAILQLAGLTAKVAHAGGVIGEVSAARQVPGWIFAGAARYHTGGIAGLKPGEVPAILRRGEEVITESDPRHVANGGLAAAGGVQAVRINLLDDRSNIGDYMSSADGERVVLEMLERNSMRARTVLGIG